MPTTRRTFVHNSAIAASTVVAGGLLAGAPHLFAGDAAPRRVKVALVGTAHSHALGKLSALLKLADLYEVVAIVEPDEQRRRALAAQNAFAQIPMMSEEQLLNVPGLSAVLVETEVKDVVPTAARFAPAGLHIHAEKPCGPSLPAFARLLDAVKQKGRILQTGYMFRRNPGFEFCMRAVRAGMLGEIYEISGVIGKVADPAERKSTAQFSGGMMFELACHLIDPTVRLLGKPDQVHSLLRRTRPEQDSLADNTLAVFEYPRALATIRSAAIDVEGGNRRSFAVHGTQGDITILPLEAPKVSLTLAKAHGEYRQGKQSIEMRKMPGRYDDQLADFARMIRGEQPVDFDAGHELAVLETVLRASGMPTDV